MPKSIDLGWGCEVFALAIAIQNIVLGLGLPLALTTIVLTGIFALSSILATSAWLIPTDDPYEQYANGHYKDIIPISDIIIDIYKNAIIKKKDVNLERHIILEEISSLENNEDDILMKLLFKIIYKNQSASRTILGTKKSLKNIKTIDLINYKKKYYRSNNSFIILCGKICSGHNIHS